MTARVGVVIPSYNHAHFVADAIRSVLDQTIDDIELVVVDDGSRDGSPDVIQEAFGQFPGRAARLIEQPNAGAHAAIMRGMAELDTPILAVLNSDDLYETDRFERMLPRLESPLAIAFSAVHLIDEQGAALGPEHSWSRWYAQALTAVQSEPTIGFALFIHNFSVTSGNFVFTRALYDNLGGFGGQKFVHDWDFLIRAAALTEPQFEPARLMRYRIHETNTTESVRSALEHECSGSFEGYMRLLASPNARDSAPGPRGWPHYWPRFTAERKPFWKNGGFPQVVLTESSNA